MIIYILIITGVLFIILGFINIMQSIESINWIETDGIIIESQFLKKRELHSDESGGSYMVYQSVFKYQYQPKNSDKKFIGTKLFRINSNGWTTSREEQYSIFKKLQKGAKIKVYYNPKNIVKSCLIKGINHYIFYTFIIGILLIGLGIGIYFQELYSNGLMLLLDKVESTK